MSGKALRLAPQGFTLNRQRFRTSRGEPKPGDGFAFASGQRIRVLKERLSSVPRSLLAIPILLASLSAAPNLEGAFGAGLGLLMLAIAAEDARHFRIPDQLSLAAFILGLAQVAIGDLEGWPEPMAWAWLRAAVAALSFYLLRALYHRVRGRQGLGLGDVKLAAVAGVWLDLALLPVAIEMAALSALILYGISRFLARQPLEATAKLPFGLYFAPAIWLCWLLGTIFGRV